MSTKLIPVDEVSGRPAADEPAGLDDFIRLSEVLLDARGQLSRSAAIEVYAIVVAAAPARYGIDGTQPPMTALLATFNEVAAAGPDDVEKRLVSVLYADGTLGPMAKNVIITWYNGGLGMAVLSPANYGAALVWPAISAQPPGLPGPYFGNWAYPPPGLVSAPAATAPDRAAAPPMQTTPVQTAAAHHAPAEPAAAQEQP
ncbi:MAG: hypothetical protein QOI26_553 [Pseudonocardiales bacterium]|nr:hypothetical protein [Pseudonocardiales bacterium]